jgi:hypothetical protein
MSDDMQMQWLREQANLIMEKNGYARDLEVADSDWEKVRGFLEEVMNSDAFDRALDLEWKVLELQVPDPQEETYPELHVQVSLSDAFLEELIEDFAAELQSEGFLIEILPRQIERLMLSLDYFQDGFLAGYGKKPS